MISKPGGTREMLSARPTDVARGLQGTQLGHFKLEEFVGGGGMGAVFRALDLELGRTVAVKVVPCERTDEETLRRFKNEAQSAARLDHGRIARVFYVGVDKGWHYIVFEFVEGVNIRDLVEHKGPLSLEETIQYTRQVAEALDHAWRREVVHRDVKPSNVLVMQDGTVKVVDMGLARLHQVESSSEDLTESGVTLGTFDYISPEQARDPRAADVRSDLYSLGCTMYYMLTGRPPFPDGTVLQKLLRHSSEAPPPVSEFRGDLPESLVGVVSMLLAKHPDGRFQAPAELIAALDQVAVELGISVEPTTVTLTAPGGRGEPRWAAHIGWLAPLAALGLIAVALNWSGRADDTDPPEPRLELATPTPLQAAALPSRPTEALSSVSVQLDPRQDSGAARYSDELEQLGPPETAGEVSAVAATLDPHRIIVRGDGEPDTPGVAHVASLEEAVEQLNQSDDLKTIELQFDGDLDARPLRLTTSRPVTIEAGEGYRPRLRFRPDGAEPLGQRMISLAKSGHLTVRSVRMLLELPESTASIGWSLFNLEGDAKLNLRDCVLSFDSDGARHQSSVFEIAGRSSTDMGEEESAGWQRAEVMLTRCIARGATSLVKCQGAPFVCSWTDGLLAIAGDVVDARGMAEEPSMRLTMHTELTNVTVFSERGGLGLLEAPREAPHLLVFSFNLTNCAVTSSATELITHVGVESADQASQWVHLLGLNNLIDPGLLWHKVTTSQQDVSSDPLLPSVLGVREAPSWSRLAPDVLLGHRMPSEFTLDNQLEGPVPGGPLEALEQLLPSDDP